MQSYLQRNKEKNETAVLEKLLLRNSSLQLINDLVSTKVLPYDCTVSDLPGIALPGDNGLPLIRDTDGSDFLGTRTDLLKSSQHHPLRILPDLLGLMLYPAGLDKMLVMF